MVELKLQTTTPSSCDLMQALLMGRVKAQDVAADDQEEALLGAGSSNAIEIYGLQKVFRRHIKWCPRLSCVSESFGSLDCNTGGHLIASYLCLHVQYVAPHYPSVMICTCARRTSKSPLVGAGPGTRVSGGSRCLVLHNTADGAEVTFGH